MLALAAALIASGMAWQARRDHAALERELVRRQDEARTQVVEARALARAAEEAARDAQAKSLLLESRMAESTVQRSQVESMMLSLSKTRDDNVVAELDAVLRAATVQSAWSGRGEPLVAALKQVDERLAATPSPRLTHVRRAIARDLQRLEATAGVDSTALAQRVDELLRQADGWPLLAQVDVAPDQAPPARSSAAKATASADAPTAGRPTLPLDTPARRADETAPGADAPWRDRVAHAWRTWWQSVVHEARSLVRIRRTEQPGAWTLTPEQAYFMRENLKLRLLSARLALLSRQRDVVQTDVSEVKRLLTQYYDPQSQRVVAALETLSQVQAAAQQVAAPRPDDTLSALAALQPGAAR